MYLGVNDDITEFPPEWNLVQLALAALGTISIIPFVKFPLQQYLGSGKIMIVKFISNIFGNFYFAFFRVFYSHVYFLHTNCDDSNYLPSIASWITTPQKHIINCLKTYSIFERFCCNTFSNLLFFL